MQEASLELFKNKDGQFPSSPKSLLQSDYKPHKSKVQNTIYSAFVFVFSFVFDFLQKASRPFLFDDSEDKDEEEPEDTEPEIKVCFCL